MKYCAVPTCGNSSYINYRGKPNVCIVHSCRYGTEHCTCDPPHRFYPFPSKKDLEDRERWTKLINRRNADGLSWQPDPAGRSMVCSAHFPDGQPTKQNPDPVLKLGYDPPADLLKRPQPKPRKQKKPESDLKPEERWSVPSLLTAEPQLLPACPHSSSSHQPITQTSGTMIAIIPQTKPKLRPPRRLCMACQNISVNCQQVSSNRGRLDLQKCLKHYLNLEVEHGWMCINCVRQVKTIVKKVNMFRSSVLAGQCNSVYKVAQVAVESGVQMQSDTNNEHQTLTSSDCQCSSLLTSMLSKQNVCLPTGKTRIRVICPEPTDASATDSESESSEDLQDSYSSEEEDWCEQPRNKKCCTASNNRRNVATYTLRSNASVSLDMQREPLADYDQHTQLTNQIEQLSERPSSSGDTVQLPDTQLLVSSPGQGPGVADLSLPPATSSESVQSAPLPLPAQPTVDASSPPISAQGLPVTATASEDQINFVYTQTLNELAKYVARKPVQEHDYAH